MSKRAVLLINLGSPDQPEVPEVRRYLNQFLMDPYVIQLPWVLRRLLVSTLVLPSRPPRTAEAYRSIWQPEGSPLLVLSQRLVEALRERMDLPVALAMRYGKPSIEDGLRELARQDLDEILLIPLYPHYAESTVKTSIEATRRALRRIAPNLRLLVLKPFYQEPDYIDALNASAMPWLERVADYDHVVFSYHGLPESHLKRADPTGAHCLRQADCCTRPSEAHATCYRHQVFRTTELLVAQAGLDKQPFTVTFQSRLGRAKWLEPATQDTLVRLAREGARKVLVLCPAFVTDCLETLEEIALQNDEAFRAAGGEQLDLVPCLNDHPRWVEVLADWCRSRELHRLQEVALT